MGCMLSSCLGLPSQVQGGEFNPLPQYMPPALKCSQPGALLYSLVMAKGFWQVFVLPSTSSTDKVCVQCEQAEFQKLVVQNQAVCEQLAL
jgi:hypothetical protein